ncbi:UNVERIFIED_CONTAM: hypothetical protein HDU68_011798 [Siphonaria sp. JEL0065]|nr:hypothetical protein HDU68_011798 [Siphonaria sp. JEL0065]
MIRVDGEEKQRRPSSTLSSITVPSLTRRVSKEQTVYAHVDECPISPTLMPPVSPLLSRMSQKGSSASLKDLALEPAVPLPTPLPRKHTMTHTHQPSSPLQSHPHPPIPPQQQSLALLHDDDTPATSAMINALSSRFEAVTRDLTEKLDSQSDLLDRMFAYIQRIDKQSEAIGDEIVALRKDFKALKLKQ